MHGFCHALSGSVSEVLCSVMFILRLSLWCHQDYSPSRSLSLAWLLAYLQSHLCHLSGYIWFAEDLYLSSHYVLTFLEWEIKKWIINFELSERESLLNKVNTPTAWSRPFFNSDEGMHTIKWEKIIRIFKKIMKIIHVVYSIFFLKEVFVRFQ